MDLPGQEEQERQYNWDRLYQRGKGASALSNGSPPPGSESGERKVGHEVGLLGRRIVAGILPAGVSNRQP